MRFNCSRQGSCYLKAWSLLMSKIVTQEKKYLLKARICPQGLSYALRASLFILPFVFLHSFPLSYITPKWVFVFSSLGLVMLMFFYNAPRLYFPKLTRPIFCGLCLIGLMMNINSFFHNTSLISLEHTRRFFFFVATLLFFNFFHAVGKKEFTHIKRAIFISSALFIIGAVGQYIYQPWIPPQWTFGNINLAAEFIGFSFALQLGASSK